MANEAVIVELLGDGGDPVDYTFQLDKTPFEKGTLMTVVDPRTITGHNLTTGAPAGILVAEKVASDGQLNGACYTHGIFDLTNSSGETIPVGGLVRFSGHNLVGPAKAPDQSGGFVIGRALEAAAASEVFECLVRI